MRTTNTFGVHFISRTNKAKEKHALLYARISVDSQRVEISLKKSIDPDIWNNERGLAKGSNANVKALNTYLEQTRSRLTECYQELSLKKKLITAVEVKNLYCGIEEKGQTVLTLFEYHNTHMASVLEWGTLKNYLTTKRYMEEFIKTKLKTSDIYLSQLNFKFLSDFEYFLRTYVSKTNQKTCKQNTIMKHIERLRKLINLAIRYEWLERDPFMKFKSSFTRSTRQFLTAGELETIEQKEFKIQRLQQIKDLFVFSCYTGLSYIDVFELTPQNITLGIDGGYWINTSRHKTDIPVRVPLLPKPLAIIEKYKNNPQVLASGSLLPVCSNQKLNAYLKEIADVCSIEKPLTFHIARHTFATTVTLTNGVPIETVSKLLGHTSIRTTQIYAKVIEKKVSDDMLLLRTKLEPSSNPKKKVLRNIS